MFVLIRVVFKIFACSIILAGVNIVCVDILRAELLRFDGNWRYRQSGGEQDDQSSLSQTYRLAFDKDLTASMLFNGNLRYTKENHSSADDSNLYNPSASLDLRNDLFLFNLNGSSTQRDVENQPRVDSDSWNVNWSSLVKRLPKLRLNFGQAFNRDNLSPKERDSVSTNYGASLSHTYAPFGFLYDLRVNELEDFVAKRKSESQFHLGQIHYQQSFLQQKLTVTASEQVSFSNSESAVNTAFGAPLFQPLPPSVLGGALVSNDDTPEDSVLTVQNDLLDQDFSTEVIEILQPTESVNLGIKVNFNAVNRVDVYFSDALIDSDSSQIIWTAYTSNNNFTWTQIPIQSVFYFDDLIAGSVRTVAEIVLVASSSPALEFDYIKIVAESPGAPAVINNAFVSELEVGLVSVGSGSTVTSEFETTQNTGRFGISYRPSGLWSMRYNFGHSRAENSPGFERSGRDQSLAATYAPSATLSFGAHLSESVNEVKTKQEQASRTMSLSMHAIPLTTLDYSLGYTRSESFTDGSRVQVLDTVSLYSTARIFPDLSGSASLTLTESDNLLIQSEVSTWTTRLDLTARISPKLNLDTEYSYSHSENKSPGTAAQTSIAISYRGTLSYRPSGAFLVQSTAEHSVTENDTLLTGVFSWRVTPRLQLSEHVTIKLAEVDSNAFTTRLTWRMGRHFSLNSSYLYQKVESGDLYSSFLSMTVNF